MSDSQKTIDRIRTLLQRTEERGASEAEENTAARMVWIDEAVAKEKNLRYR